MNVDRTTLIAVLFATLLVAPAALPVAATSTSGGTPGPAAAGPASTQTACAFPVEYEDATRTTVRIEADPERVVTLAPSSAQTMWEIGAREEVVGVSQFATYLEGADEKANVSAPGFGNYDTERIVALNPDLVLAPNVVGNQTVQQLRETGLTVVKFEGATTIEDVRQKTTLIGQLTGNCEGAAEANRWMDRNLQAVHETTEGRDQPKAVYVFGTFTSGSGTFIHDMIATAGARNVMAEAGVSGYNPVNKEVVAERDPSWIVTDRPDSGILEQTPYNQTAAGQAGNLVAIQPNYINQPAPRSVVYAVRNLTEAFHGDVYGESDYVSRSEVEVTTTQTTADTTTGSTMTTTADTTSTTAETSVVDDDASQSTPGFGIPAALLGIAALVVLIVRRRE